MYIFAPTLTNRGLATGARQGQTAEAVRPDEMDRGAGTDSDRVCPHSQGKARPALLAKNGQGGAASQAERRRLRPSKPTELDGWVLKLFPDEQGVTLDKMPHTRDMPADHVRVDFKYLTVAPGTGEVLRETPMELWAGFIGAEEDTIANTLMPKIGWLERINRLMLDFTDKVVLPTWMDKLTIGNFSISGKMTEEEKAEIQKRFPKAVINNR